MNTSGKIENKRFVMKEASNAFASYFLFDTRQSNAVRLVCVIFVFTVTTDAGGENDRYLRIFE